MKILILVVCVLTITTMVYTDVQTEHAQNVKMNLAICADELNLPVQNEFYPLLIKCMLEKNSLIDEYGTMKKDEILNYFGHMTSSQRELQKIASCIDQETQTTEDNDQKIFAAIQCSLFKLAQLEKQF